MKTQSMDKLELVAVEILRMTKHPNSAYFKSDKGKLLTEVYRESLWDILKYVRKLQGFK